MEEIFPETPRCIVALQSNRGAQPPLKDSSENYGGELETERWLQSSYQKEGVTWKWQAEDDSGRRRWTPILQGATTSLRGHYSREQTDSKTAEQTRQTKWWPLSSFSLLPLSFALCLHLHSTLNRVFRDTWQVARHGAEFQSAPS